MGTDRNPFSKIDMEVYAAFLNLPAGYDINSIYIFEKSFRGFFYVLEDDESTTAERFHFSLIWG